VGIALVVALCLLGNALVLWYSKDLVFLDTVDFWVGSFFLFVMGALQVIFFSWVFGIEKAREEAHRGALIRIPQPMWFVIKYVAPVFVIVVFIGFCVQKLHEYVGAISASPVAQLALALIAAVIVGLVVAVRIGEKRWRAAGIDIDDTARDSEGGGGR
jgi:hypothetical protein